MDGVVAPGRASRLRWRQEVACSVEEPVVSPNPSHKTNKRLEGCMAGKEAGDGRAILWKARDEVEQLDVPGDLESSRGDGDLGATGGLSSSKQGGLEHLEDLPGVDIGARVNPAGVEGGGELRALSDPLRETWNGAR